MNNFDFNKIKDFDRHINLSIPNYDFLSNHLKFLVEALTESETNVLDLGCSTGSLLLSLERNKSCNYFGYDISNLLPLELETEVNFEKSDITKIDFPTNTSVISSIFTLQFLPRHKRKEVIQKAYDSLNDGGYFIVCEKTHSNDPCLESITNSIYYKYKREHFTDEEILQKQQELTSVMKLKTPKEIEEELSIFSFVEIFWKSYGFCGFIARK